MVRSPDRRGPVAAGLSSAIHKKCKVARPFDLGSTTEIPMLFRGSRLYACQHRCKEGTANFSKTSPDIDGNREKSTQLRSKKNANLRRQRLENVLELVDYRYDSSPRAAHTHVVGPNVEVCDGIHSSAGRLFSSTAKTMRSREIPRIIHCTCRVAPTPHPRPRTSGTIPKYISSHCSCSGWSANSTQPTSCPACVAMSHHSGR